MPVDAFTHFVFVDFENVPNVDLGVVGSHPVHVTFLIGRNQKKLDLALVREIQRLGDAVELVEVGASGHNALDLTLAFYLGRALERNPGAEFCIVSKDKDFEPLLGHLTFQGVKVGRYESFGGLPFLAPVKKLGAAVKGLTALPQGSDRKVKVMARLRNPNTRNRPTSLKALLAHITASLGKEATAAGAEELVAELREKRALTIDSKGKVSYPSAS